MKTNRYRRVNRNLVLIIVGANFCGAALTSLYFALLTIDVEIRSGLVWGISGVVPLLMMMLSYPSRWKYDILRALEYFRAAGISYDPRMQPALDVLIKKQRKDGRWPVQAKHPGKTHFDMEQTGKPSRWNTLRASRVLKHFQLDYFGQGS